MFIPNTSRMKRARKALEKALRNEKKRSAKAKKAITKFRKEAKRASDMYKKGRKE